MGEKDLQTKKIVEFRIFCVMVIKYLHLGKYLSFLVFFILNMTTILEAVALNFKLTQTSI